MALWNVNWFGPCLAEGIDNVVTRAARINYFCKHSVTIEGVDKTHLFANLSWFLYHPKHTQLGKPISIWYHDLFEARGVHSFLPVKLIKCCCVSLTDVIDNEEVFVTVPCIN